MKETRQPELAGFYEGRPVWIVDDPDAWAYKDGPTYVRPGSPELFDLLKDISYIPAHIVPAFPMAPLSFEERVACAVVKQIQAMIKSPYTYGLDKFMKR